MDVILPLLTPSVTCRIKNLGCNSYLSCDKPGQFTVNKIIGGKSEQFILTRRVVENQPTNRNAISIKSQFERFLSAERRGGSGDRTWVKTWEVFTVELLPKGKIRFKTFWNTYLAVVRDSKLGTTKNPEDPSCFWIIERESSIIGELLKRWNTMPQNDKFEFTNLYINDEELKVICSVLKTKKQIQFLKLSNNWISDEGAKLLAQEIRLGNTIYKKIWLDQNAITGEGVKALAEALELTDQIDLLHLGANNIGTDGAQFIAAALRKNTSLTYLSLADNKLLDQGTAFIAAALQENHKLHFLYLDRNFITDASAEILAVALQDNRGVSELSLAQNNISLSVARKLINKRLKELELFGNPRITETDLKVIEEQIQANNTPQILLHIKAIPEQKQEINVRIPEERNNTNVNTATNSSDSRLCVICEDKPATMLFNNCGHLCVCECAIRASLFKCPICRKDGQLIKLYRV
jgi:hypothetical protein